MLQAGLLGAGLLIALWLVTHLTVAWSLDEAMKARVDVEVAALVDIYQSGGEAELLERLRDREALDPLTAAPTLYTVTHDRRGRIGGADIDWPPLDAQRSEMDWLNLTDGRSGWARATLISPDTSLLVFQDGRERGAILWRIAAAFAIAGALLLAIALWLGQRSASALAARIERLNAGFRTPAVESGTELGVHTSGHGDEIDELARHSAAAVARMQRLADANRDTADQIAHEIRTPLMHLDNRLQRTLNLAPHAEIAERIVEARAEIRRLVAMLESLLDIASSQAHRGDTSRLKPVDLSALVMRLCDLFRDSAEDAGLELQYTIAPSIIIPAEEMAMARLVTNLLDNAIKYVPAGGRIRVTLEPGPVLSVADNGPGIPTDRQDAVFDRFARGEDALNDTQRGNGLGLALAAAIAERHGLSLRLDRESEGARFVMEPPV